MNIIKTQEIIKERKLIMIVNGIKLIWIYHFKKREKSLKRVRFLKSSQLIFKILIIKEVP